MTDPLDLYWALVETLKAGDDAAVRDLIDPDFVMEEDPGMPYGGTYRGQDGFFELIGKVWTAWGGSHFEPQYQMVDREAGRVCAIVKFRGTPGGSAEEVETLINEIWEFRDGKAIRAQVWYYDSPRLTKAMAG